MHSHSCYGLSIHAVAYSPVVQKPYSLMQSHVSIVVVTADFECNIKKKILA